MSRFSLALLFAGLFFPASLLARPKLPEPEPPAQGPSQPSAGPLAKLDGYWMFGDGGRDAVVRYDLEAGLAVEYHFEETARRIFTSSLTLDTARSYTLVLKGVDPPTPDLPAGSRTECVLDSLNERGLKAACNVIIKQGRRKPQVFPIEITLIRITEERFNTWMAPWLDPTSTHKLGQP